MRKIASPEELRSELRRLMAYCEGPEKPSREKLAAELNGLADKVAGPRTASDSALDYILDQNDLGDIYGKLMDEDEQSAELFKDVIDKLGAKLKLGSGEQEALSRVLDIVKRGKSWQIDLLRNNVFKAANALGIRLPSGMF